MGNPGVPRDSEQQRWNVRSVNSHDSPQRKLVISEGNGLDSHAMQSEAAQDEEDYYRFASSAQKIKRDYLPKQCPAGRREEVVEMGEDDGERR